MPTTDSAPAPTGLHIGWLGELPPHWAARRLKFLVTFLGGGTPSKDNQQYWNGDLPWVSPKDMRHEIIHDTEDHITQEGLSESTTQLVPTGSALLVFRSGILKHKIPVAITSLPVALNQDMKALVPHPNVSARYLAYVIRGHQEPLLAIWRKAGATVESLELERVANSLFPLPPLPEQKAIATFLDRETTKIDRLIEKKQLLIERLEEKRTALISHAVTKGLDPDVPMKDSGVEWLGKVPEHWACLALARVTSARCDGPFGSGLKSEHYTSTGVRVIRLQNIGFGEFLPTDEAFIDESYYDDKLGDHSVIAGDLLLAGLGDERHPVGRACVAPEGLGRAMVKADCFRFRLTKERLLPRFAALQLSSSARAAAGALTTGATRARMNLSTTSARRLAIPPLEEQEHIVAYVDQAQTAIRGLVERIGTAIQRLQEYRTALISAAVTGKIDVRGEVEMDEVP